METKEQKLAEAMSVIMDCCNSFNGGKDMVQIIFTGVRTQHRTIQQSFWRVMSQVILQYAEENSDLRNANSVEFCKEVAILLKDKGIGFPMI